MAEISPPTTRPLPPDPPLVRTLHDRGGTRVMVRGQDSCPAAPTPPPPDVTNPVVDNFSPANGSQLLPKQSISFTVTDNSSLIRKIFVCAIFADGEVDTVYDGDRFTPQYVSTSSRSIIPFGFSFSVQPVLGWTKSPTIRVYALDYAGNEN